MHRARVLVRKRCGARIIQTDGTCTRYEAQDAYVAEGQNESVTIQSACITERQNECVARRKVCILQKDKSGVLQCTKRVYYRAVLARTNVLQKRRN